MSKHSNDFEDDPPSSPDLAPTYAALSSHYVAALQALLEGGYDGVDDRRMFRAALAALSWLRQAEAQSLAQDGSGDDSDLEALRIDIGRRLDRLRASLDAERISREPDGS